MDISGSDSLFLLVVCAEQWREAREQFQKGRFPGRFQGAILILTSPRRETRPRARERERERVIHRYATQPKYIDIYTLACATSVYIYTNTRGCLRGLGRPPTFPRARACGSERKGRRIETHSGRKRMSLYCPSIGGAAASRRLYMRAVAMDCYAILVSHRNA